MKWMSKVTWDLKVGETLRVGEVADITLMEKSGKLARLSIEADPKVKIELARENTGRLAAQGLTTRFA